MQYSTESKGIENSLTQLQEVIASSAYKLPIFVRFQSPEQYLTVAVNSISIIEGTVVIEGDSGDRLVLEMEKLTSVAAFRDASGKAIFLHNFDAEEETMPEIRRRVDFERFILAKRAAEEYRQVQEWMYDFVHFKKSGSVSTELLSAVDRYGSESLSYDDDASDASEAIEALHMAA